MKQSIFGTIQSGLKGINKMHINSSELEKNNTLCCCNCKYWQDYNYRVHAVIQDVTTTHAENLIELRWCKYQHPPGIHIHLSIYTPANHACSGYTPK